MVSRKSDRASVYFPWKWFKVLCPGPRLCLLSRPWHRSGIRAGRGAGGRRGRAVPHITLPPGWKKMTDAVLPTVNQFTDISAPNIFFNCCETKMFRIFSANLSSSHMTIIDQLPSHKKDVFIAVYIGCLEY